MPYCRLPNRQLIRISGSDAEHFLQGLVSNDVTRASETESVYAAMLTPQGKYLFDFLIQKDGADFLLDIEAERADALVKRLSMYKLRSDVSITPEAVDTYALWDVTKRPDGTVRDPRHAALGWRFHGDSNVLAGIEKAPFEAYDTHRIRLGIPDGSRDMPVESTILLENRFEALSGVDFNKGCYVGQEVTARMRHKTTLRKGLLRVAVEGEAPPPGAPLLTAEGKEAGALFTVADGAGLAHLRFDRANAPLTAGSATVRATDLPAQPPE